MSKFGQRLLESAKQARQIARGEREPARMHVPAEIDVKEIRTRIGMTQDDFASAFGFSINQIRDWEQSRTRPLAGHRAYLLIISRHHELVLQLLHDASAPAEEDVDGGDRGDSGTVLRFG